MQYLHLIRKWMVTICSVVGTVYVDFKNGTISYHSKLVLSWIYWTSTYSHTIHILHVNSDRNCSFSEMASKIIAFQTLFVAWFKHWACALGTKMHARKHYIQTKFCHKPNDYRSVPLIRPLRKYAPPPSFPPTFLHRVV